MNALSIESGAQPSALLESIPALDVSNFVLQNLDVDDETSRQLKDACYSGNKLIREALQSASQRHVLNQMVQQSKLPAYKLSHIHTPEMVQRLATCYPMFRITCDVNNNALNHCFARESRGLDFALLLRLVRHDNDYKLLKHQVFLKDIGGNPIAHDSQKISNSHVCRPYLDYKDVSRRQSDRSYFEQYSADADLKPESHPFIHAHRSNKNVLCHQKGQHCKVTAKYVIFCHSTYDMSIDDIADTLERADCEAGFACFLYDPHMLYTNKGTLIMHDCDWEINTVNGVRNIRFIFRNEMTSAYTHNFDTYIRLLFQNYILCSDGRAYSVEPIHDTNCTVFLKFTRVLSSSIPTGHILRTIPFKDENDFYVLHTYKFNTILDKSNEYNRVTPITVLAPKPLYAALRSYVSTLAGAKFTIQHTINAAQGMSSRLVVNGISLKSYKMDPDHIMHMAIFCYLEAFKSNYETGKMLNILVDDEKSVRPGWSSYTDSVRFAFRSLHYILSRNGLRETHPFKGQDLKIKVRGDKQDDEDFQLIPEIEFDKTSIINTFAQWWGRLSSTKNRFPVLKLENRRVLFSQEIVNAIPVKNGAIDLTALKMPSPAVLVEFMANESTRLQAVANRHRDCLAVPREQLPVGNIHPFLRDRYTVGDGNCFFHALANGLDIVDNPNAIRSRLACSDFMKMLFLKQEISTLTTNTIDITDTHVEKMVRNRLQPLAAPDDKSRWADDKVVMVAAFEYGVTIVVCTGTQSAMSYNPRASATIEGENVGKTIYMRHHENHYTLCDFVPDPNSLLTQDIFVAQNEVLVPYPYFSFFESLAQYCVTAENPMCPVKRISDKLYSMSRINGVNTTFANFLGPAVGNLLAVSGVDVDDMSVLDYNARHSSTLQYFCNCTRSSVTAVLLNSGGSYVSLVRQPQYFTIRPGDISHIADQFDFININPRIYSDRFQTIQEDTADAYLATALGILTRLKKGGSCLIAMYAPISAFSLNVIAMLSVHFENLQLVRSRLLPEYSPWVFLFCKNLLTDVSATLPSRAMLVPDEFGSLLQSSVVFFNELVLSEHRAMVGMLNSVNHHQQDKCYVMNVNTWTPKIITTEGGYGFCDTLRWVRGFVTNFATCSDSGMLYGPTYASDTYKEEFSFPQLNRMAKKIRFDFSHEFKRAVLTKCGLSGRFNEEFLCYIKDESQPKFFRYYLLCLYYYGETSAVPLQFDVCSTVSITTKHIRQPQADFISKVSMFFSRYEYGTPAVSAIANTVSEVTHRNDAGLTELLCDENRPQLAMHYGEDSINVLNSIRTNACAMVAYTRPVEQEDKRDDAEDSAIDESDGAVSGGFENDTASDSPLTWHPDSYAYARSRDYRPIIDEYVYITNMAVTYTQATLQRIVGNLNAAICGGRLERSDIRHVLAAHPGSYVGIDDTVYDANARTVSIDEVVRVGSRYVCDFSSVTTTTVTTDCKVHLMPRSAKDAADSLRKRKRFLIIPDLHIFFEYDIAVALQKDKVSSIADGVTVSLVQAGPGCGKTHEIVNYTCSHVKNKTGIKLLVVVKNRVSSDDVVDRLVKRYTSLYGKVNTKALIAKFKAIVFSIDNLVVSPVKADLILVDEGMIMHPGKILTMVSRCANKDASVSVYGDVFQISFICRVNVGPEHKMYTETAKCFPVVKMMSVTHRCPKDVTFYLSTLYSVLARDLGIDVTDPHAVLTSTSDEPPITVYCKKISSVEQVPPFDAGIQYLTFTQSCKDTMLSKGYKNTVTIHEFQGSQADQVVVVRDVITDSQDIAGGVYESEPHVVSGISRHLKKMVYYTVLDSDKLSKVIHMISAQYPAYLSRLV